MAANLAKWPSNRGLISKIRPSDGCKGNTVPSTVVQGYDLRKPGGHLGNVGLTVDKLNGGRPIIDELGFVPLSKTGAELLFEVFSQRYERGSTLVTSNLPFDEWTEVFGSERLTGALLDRLTRHVHILEMNGESYRLNQSRRKRKSRQSS